MELSFYPPLGRPTAGGRQYVLSSIPSPPTPSTPHSSCCCFGPLTFLRDKEVRWGRKSRKLRCYSMVYLHTRASSSSQVGHCMGSWWTVRALVPYLSYTPGRLESIPIHHFPSPGEAASASGFSQLSSALFSLQVSPLGQDLLQNAPWLSPARGSDLAHINIPAFILPQQFSRGDGYSVKPPVLDLSVNIAHLHVFCP